MKQGDDFLCETGSLKPEAHRPGRTSSQEDIGVAWRSFRLKLVILI